MEANKILSADILDIIFDGQEQGLWGLWSAKNL